MPDGIGGIVSGLANSANQVVQTVQSGAGAIANTASQGVARAVQTIAPVVAPVAQAIAPAAPPMSRGGGASYTPVIIEPAPQPTAPVVTTPKGPGTTIYVPYGNQAQTAIENARAVVDRKTGEIAIYQQVRDVNLPAGQYRSPSLIGGGGRAALQSGAFTVEAPETPVVYSQTGKLVETPAAAAVLAEPSKYSRLGAEAYGGFVQPLDSRTIESTGSKLSTYLNPQNLARYAEPQGVNVPKAQAPGMAIPWTIPSSSPVLQYGNEKGPTGVEIPLPSIESRKVVEPVPAQAPSGVREIGTTGIYVSPIMARRISPPTPEQLSTIPDVAKTHSNASISDFALNVGSATANALSFGLLNLPTKRGFASEIITENIPLSERFAKSPGASYTPVYVSESGSKTPITITTTKTTYEPSVYEDINRSIARILPPAPESLKKDTGAISQFITGAYEIARENPLDIAKNLSLAVITMGATEYVGGALAGASAGTRLEPVIKPVFAAAPYALGAIYAGSVAERATEGFKEFGSPAAYRLGGIVSTETAPFVAGGLMYANAGRFGSLFGSSKTPTVSPAIPGERVIPPELSPPTSEKQIYSFTDTTNPKGRVSRVYLTELSDWYKPVEAVESTPRKLPESKTYLSLPESILEPVSEPVSPGVGRSVTPAGVITVRGATKYGGVKLTREQGAEYIKARYPGQEEIYSDYLTKTQMAPRQYMELQRQLGEEETPSPLGSRGYRQPLEINIPTEEEITGIPSAIVTGGELKPIIPFVEPITVVERRMIIAQYDLTPEEISVAKVQGLSLNDILKMRESVSKPIVVPEPIPVTTVEPGTGGGFSGSGKGTSGTTKTINVPPFEITGIETIPGIGIIPGIGRTPKNIPGTIPRVTPREIPEYTPDFIRKTTPSEIPGLPTPTVPPGTIPDIVPATTTGSPSEDTGTPFIPSFYFPPPPTGGTLSNPPPYVPPPVTQTPPPPEPPVPVVPFIPVIPGLSGGGGGGGGSKSSRLIAQLESFYVGPRKYRVKIPKYMRV